MTLNTLNSHSLFMTFRHKAFIKIMEFVRDYIFECLCYSRDSNNIKLMKSVRDYIFECLRYSQGSKLFES